MLSRILFIFTFLIISCGFSFPVFAEDSSYVPSDAPLNPAFVEWLNSRKKGVSANKKEKVRVKTASGKEETIEIITGGSIPPAIDRSHLKGVFGISRRSSKIPNKMSLGASPSGSVPVPLMCDPENDSVCDMRTMGFLSSIRNQNPYGNCWAYATFASLEANLRKDKSEDNDFDEIHMASNHGFDWDINDGGNSEIAIAYLSRWSGPVAQNTGGPVIKHVQGMQFIPGVSSEYYGPDTGYDPVYISNVKRAIAAYGPVFVSISAQTRFFKNSSQSNPYFYAYDCSAPRNVSGGTCTGEGKSGHAVSLVGWDDTIPASNFTNSGHTPPGDGAFIMRNSWGSYVGNSGYYYISYYDTSLGGETVVFDTAEDTDNYTRFYSHEVLGQTTAAHYSSNIVWGAVVFKADKDEVLKAVSFHLEGVKEKYNVYIYTDLSNKTSPKSGTEHIGPSGTMDNAGYYTVPLDSPIIVRKNSYFSVVIKFDTSYDQPYYNLSMESRISDYSSATTAQSGNCFVSTNGTTWNDTTSGLNPHRILPIKVFTKDDLTPPAWPASPAVSLMVDNSSGAYVFGTWPSALETESEVKGYLVAVGSEPGLDDVVSWTDTESTELSKLLSASLVFGNTYYFGVKAYNTSDAQSSAIWSEGKMYWYKHPNQPAYINDGATGGAEADLEFVVNTSTLAAHWAASVPASPDEHSEAVRYWYAIGTSSGSEAGSRNISSQIAGNVNGWIDAGLSTSVIADLSANSIEIAEGQTYYFSVVAEDSAGYRSSPVYSNGQTIDRTVPQITGIVFDHYSIDDEKIIVSTGANSGYFVINDSVAALSGTPRLYFTDNSNIPAELAVSEDGQTVNGNSSRWNFTGNFTESSLGTAYFSFAAQTKAGRDSVGTISEGRNFTIRRTTVIDHAKPSWAGSELRDGIGDDIDEISDALEDITSLSANWDEAYSASGILYYEYSIGTSTGATDVKDWTIYGTSTSVTVPASEMLVPLEYGRTYYFRVRAVNLLDVVSDVIVSDGQRIRDNPGSISAVYCAPEGTGSGYANWTSTFAAHWEASATDVPEELYATGYRYAIGTSAGGSDVKGWTTINSAGTLNVLANGLTLADNTEYYFSVKAFNALNAESPAAVCSVNIMRTPAKITSVEISGSNHSYDSIDGTDVVSYGDIYGSIILDKPAAAISGNPSLKFADHDGRETVLDIFQDGVNQNKWNFTGNVGNENVLGTATFLYNSSTKAGLPGSVIESGSTFEIRRTTVTDHESPIWAGAIIRHGLSGETSERTTDSLTELSANWDAATDNETAIERYEYRIRDSEDIIRNWTDSGKTDGLPTRSLTVNGLDGLLDFGKTYFFDVKAYDMLDNASDVLSSSGTRINDEPGEIPYVNCAAEGTGIGFVDWENTFAANWGASATDIPAARHATGYKYAIGTTSGGTDVKDWTTINSAGTLNVLADGFTLADNTEYYFSVKAVNAFGRESGVRTCKTMTVRSAPAMTGVSFTGSNYNYDDVDAKRVVSYGNIQGTFVLSYPKDSIEGMPRLYYTDNADNITELAVSYVNGEWHFSGNVSVMASTGTATFSFTAVPKTTGVEIPGVVTAGTFEIRKTLIADHTVPYWPANAAVRDGSGASDIETVDTIDTLSANWDEAADNETQIDHYEYRIQDSDENIVRDWTDNGLNRSVTASGLSLQPDKRYMFNVRAYDLVGNVSAELSSNGQTVNSSPGEIPAVYCSAVSGHNAEFANWQSTFAANWAMSSQNVKPELLATGYRYSIGTSANMDSPDVKAWTDINSANTLNVLADSIVLSDGYYYFTVKAINGYAESTAKSCRIYIDHIAPKITDIDVPAVQQTGSAISGSFTLSEAAENLDGIPELYFRVSDRNYAISVLQDPGSAYSWNYSGYVGLDASIEGTAEFVLIARDKAGNIGSEIEPAHSFEINAKKDNATEEITFKSDDDVSVTVPAGTVSGNMRITITEVSGESNASVAAANSDSKGSAALSENTVRDFKAYGNDDNPISSFPNGITISFPYKDDNNDGFTDEEHFSVNMLNIFYMDPDINQWVVVPGTKRDKTNKIISVDVNHFSIFSLRILGGHNGKFVIKPSPTPCRYPDENVKFYGIPEGAQDVRIYIYNTAGELVRELEPGTDVWDGRTKHGSMAASGVYVYLVKTSSHGQSKGKMYIIW